MSVTSGTASASAETSEVSGATVQVQPDGSYSVDTHAPDYHFAGSVGAAVSNIENTTGQDGVGAYHDLSFDYTVDGIGRTSGIRSYDQSPVVLFSTTYRQASPNTAAFPALSSVPSLPNNQSYSGCFGKHTFNGAVNEVFGPYLAFDNAGGGYLVSPATNFSTAVTTAADGRLTSGTSSKIGSLNAGFTQRTVLAFGSDVNDIYRNWGNTLTGLSGKKRPDQDATNTLAKLGYWTDNGAKYYYKYDENLGYEGTLKAVREHWKEKGLPVGNMQLDSWFYPKGPDSDWRAVEAGASRYEADKTLFPNGLEDFQQNVGLPMITHGRWIDPSSPYHQEYRMSGNVVTDPAYWNDRMSYLKQNGVQTYEQDWLCSHAQPDFTLHDRDAYLGNMAKAAAANGMDIQYCMPLVQDFLQSTLYNEVTNTRVADDRFERTKWDRLLYTSRLANAVGTWPFADVAMSYETRNLVLQNLTAGPVGVGDKIGEENADNLHRVATADGTIVKPDTPLVADTATYVRDAGGAKAPMVATTGSKHGSMAAGYVYEYARNSPDTKPDTVYEAETAKLSGPVASKEHGGYTGTGYADFQHDSGDSVEWTVDVPKDGTYTLEFRFANGTAGDRPTGDDRPLAVSVDGGTAATQAFMPTANWDSWEKQPVVVPLSAGKHTVRAAATGHDGPNIDNLGVSAGVKGDEPASFRPADVGVAGQAYVYDYFAGTGSLVDAGGTHTAGVTRDGSFLQVVPVGKSGIGFLGDAGKFVSLGKQRITELSDDGTVHASVAFTPGDGAVTLHGYAPSTVSVTADGGQAGQVGYDPATHLFSVTITPDQGSSLAKVAIAGN
ncbi:carbohydrate-binding protein [Amycolatopsis ultiminotia]|uniref:carbohydrate-binding protein n=1 Tax=Amycolatopsis ultiminotia TaxID=543629 RepID=UPI0031EA5ECA